MNAVALLLVGILGAGAGTQSEYARLLTAKSLDQATLDAEGYGKRSHSNVKMAVCGSYCHPERLRQAGKHRPRSVSGVTSRSPPTS